MLVSTSQQEVIITSLVMGREEDLMDVIIMRLAQRRVKANPDLLDLIIISSAKTLVLQFKMEVIITSLAIVQDLQIAMDLTITS